ncbi:Crp/Fnr family transcriptional regulator [Xanthobacter autotrophicus]|uniref:Crp/Fnr family transcriptional regulator n=1 Tax=Xanthobacter autotrophicus TaxID=280 RepID=UPI00372ABC7D
MLNAPPHGHLPVAASPLMAVAAPAQALLLTENAALTNGPPLLFQRLTAKEREEVLCEGQKRVVYRGKMLFSQGTPHDGIFLIESGRVRVFYIAPSGREITLAYWNSGNFVGGPELFGQGQHVWSGVAATNCVVVHLTGKTLRRLIAQIPGFAIGLIEGLTFKGKCYSALAQMLGTRSVTERLAHLLLHLSDAYGVREEGAIVIGTPFTHADLAHMVGATRQWVTISLKRLQEQGVLKAEKAKIMVYDVDALHAMRGDR